VVDVITEDHTRWVDTMLMEEMGLRLDCPSPWKASLTTFVAFFLAGMIPLLPYLLLGSFSAQHMFRISIVATGIAFFFVGVMRGHVVRRPVIQSAMETMIVGGIAAAAAYFIGAWLRGIVTM